MTEIYGVITTMILGFLGVKFKGFFKHLPTLLKYTQYIIIILQAVIELFKAVADKKITKEEAQAVEKRVHLAISETFKVFDKEKGKY